MIESEDTFAQHVKALPEFAYYVSERCFGTLKDASKSRDLVDLLELFGQCCESVSFLRRRDQPVIHRDLKPANFLLAQEPRRIVLADFGIAKEQDQKTVLTETNEVVGSRFFRAPEILNGAGGNLRSDVYSMGRLLEWLLCGALPEDLVPTPVPRGGRLSDDACDRFDRTISRASAIDPNQRYASVDELQQALPTIWLDVKPQPSVALTEAPHMSAAEVRRTAIELAREEDTVGWGERVRAGGRVERLQRPVSARRSRGPRR